MENVVKKNTYNKNEKGFGKEICHKHYIPKC